MTEVCMRCLRDELVYDADGKAIDCLHCDVDDVFETVEL